MYDNGLIIAHQTLGCQSALDTIVRLKQERYPKAKIAIIGNLGGWMGDPYTIYQRSKDIDFLLGEVMEQAYASDRDLIWGTVVPRELVMYQRTKITKELQCWLGKLPTRLCPNNNLILCSDHNTLPPDYSGDFDLDKQRDEERLHTENVTKIGANQIGFASFTTYSRHIKKFSGRPPLSEIPWDSNNSIALSEITGNWIGLPRVVCHHVSLYKKHGWCVCLYRGRMYLHDIEFDPEECRTYVKRHMKKGYEKSIDFYINKHLLYPDQFN